MRFVTRAPGLTEAGALQYLSLKGIKRIMLSVPACCVAYLARHKGSHVYNACDQSPHSDSGNAPYIIKSRR